MYPPNKDNQPLLLTPASAAELLSISRSSAYEMIASGELPSIKLRGRTRIPRADLERWTDEQREAAGLVTERPSATEEKCDVGTRKLCTDNKSLPPAGFSKGSNCHAK